MRHIPGLYSHKTRAGWRQVSAISRGHHPSSEPTPSCSRERRPFSETGRIPELRKVIPQMGIQRGLSTLPSFPSEFTLELGFPKTGGNPW